MASLGERLQCCYLAVRNFLEPVEAVPLSGTCAAARFIVVSAWRQEERDFWNDDGEERADLEDTESSEDNNDTNGQEPLHYFDLDFL